MKDKTVLRKHYLNLRKHISPEDRKLAEQKVLTLFCSVAPFQHAVNIACYFSIGSELNTHSLIEAILANDKKCFLPVVTHDRLVFTQYELTDELKANQYSILEPILLKNKLPLEELDIIILPLAAFDRAGRRIGWGYGYYDKTLVRLRDDSIKRPLLVGIAFALQEAEKIPQDPWDMPLDCIITEKEVIVCSNRV